MRDAARRVSQARGIALCAFAFVLMAGYALLRPASESLFLEQHGVEALPLAWLFVAASALLVVVGYTRLLARVTLGALFPLVSLFAAVVLVLLLLALFAEVPGASFALYIFKDVYIVVLVEIFWSFASAAFSFRSARWLYGLFCVCGNLGGIVGNLGGGWIAVSLGTSTVLWLVVPTLVLAALVGTTLMKVGDIEAKSASERPGFMEAIRVVRESRYLALLLLLIAVVQVVITLIDYQYNSVVAATFVNVHERTAVIGKVYAAIDVVSLVLQVSTGAVLRFIGVSATLHLVPSALGVLLLGLLLSPAFLLGALLKVLSKALDYSLFRAAKELLYLPLGIEEKTKGKAAVDMLTYRVAKGGASLLLLSLAALKTAPDAVGITTLVLVAVWVVLTAAIARRYRAARIEASASAPS